MASTICGKSRDESRSLNASSDQRQKQSLS
jgi:hypothetical protein